jgi:hypothetical protein
VCERKRTRTRKIILDGVMSSFRMVRPNSKQLSIKSYSLIVIIYKKSNDHGMHLVGFSLNTSNNCIIAACKFAAKIFRLTEDVTVTSRFLI